RDGLARGVGEVEGGAGDERPLRPRSPPVGAPEERDGRPNEQRTHDRRVDVTANAWPIPNFWSEATLEATSEPTAAQNSGAAGLTTRPLRSRAGGHRDLVKRAGVRTPPRTPGRRCGGREGTPSAHPQMPATPRRRGRGSSFDSVSHPDD